MAPGNSWQRAICKGRAIAVSDRSFQDQQGAAAWMIEGYNKNNQILGKGSTPGLPTDQSTYRSSLFGLWGIFKALQQFCQETKIQSGHVQVACDGLSALHQAQLRKPVDPVAPHYNLIGAIRQLQQTLPIKCTFEHVQGHQDLGVTMVLN